MVKPGYKQTEAGVIPEDWSIVTVGEISIKVGSGVTPTGGSDRYYQYGRPFVRSQNIGRGTLLLDDLVFIDEETHLSFQSTELQDDDILLNITGASIGRCALADSRLSGGNVNQHVCIIRLRFGAASPYFIASFLLSSSGQRQIDSFQAGGNREGLNFAQIRTIKLPLPPSRIEQEAIASALSDVDALIESLERLIAKKRDIKRAAMQELLTGKKRLPGFESEWIVYRLEDIADIEMGQSPDSSNYNTDGCGLPLIQGNADISNRETIKRIFTNEVTKRGRAGDIIMSVRAPVGEISRTAFDVCLGRGVCAIRPRCGPDFLYQSLIFNESKWVAISKGSTFDSVTSTDVKTFEISIPMDEAEQFAISSVLSDMDAELAPLEKKLAKTRLIKQGMMQELLTGRIRLV